MKEMFSLKSFVTVAGVAMLACSQAMAAAAPTISGSYVFSHRTFCQPTITVDYATDQNGQTFVNGLNLTSSSDTEFSTGLAKFDSSTQTVSYKGVNDSGSTVLLQLSSGLQGDVFAEKKTSGSTAYSNTNSTVTLNGTTYTATYGKATKSVVGYMVLVGLSSASCSDQWEFTLK
jgi:hypothetical protein